MTLVNNSSAEAFNTAILQLRSSKSNKSTLSEEEEQLENKRKLIIEAEEEAGKYDYNPIERAMANFTDGYYIWGGTSIVVRVSWFTFDKLMVLYGTFADSNTSKPNPVQQVIGYGTTINNPAPQRYISPPISIIDPSNSPIIKAKQAMDKPVKYDMEKNTLQFVQGLYQGAIINYTWCLLGKVRD